jgi:hypothetical protein
MAGSKGNLLARPASTLAWVSRANLISRMLRGYGSDAKPDVDQVLCFEQTKFIIGTSDNPPAITRASSRNL